jgi:hypothetical protein
MAAALEDVATISWADANRDCLAKEMRRMRLLMQRRACWLRQGWQEDSLAAHRGLVISDTRADQMLRGADDAAEQSFLREDPRAHGIGLELAALEIELARERRSRASGGMSSLETLVELFGLQSFERDALLLCFSVAEDPDFATLCAYLQDDSSATRVTPHLLLGVLCADREMRATARSLLTPAGALRHFRLIRAGPDEASPAMRAMHVDERVADFLRGLNRPDERLVHLLRPVTRERMHGAHETIVAGLTRWAESATRQPWPVFNVTGAPGAGKRAIAAEFCARVGLQLQAIDPRCVPVSDAERHEFLHLLQREAVLLRMAFFADVSDLDSGDRALYAAVRDLMERFSGVLFVAGRERWRMSRELLHVAVPKLDAGEQRRLWDSALQGVPNSVNGQIEDIVQQFDFGPAAIPQAVLSAVSRARSRAADEVVGPDDLWQACRTHASAQLGGLAERLVPGYTWDDIVLADDLMQQVRELADQVAARNQVYEKWGFGARLPRGRGIAALFCGPSGTGKTMTAEILANHLRLDLYRIDLAGVVSKYIGETEKNLRNIFDAAEQSGAILFFDEADALFGKRTEVRDSHDRYANIEVNYLLQRMEDYRGLAILCTNRRASLDRAFLRRLRFLIEFPFPDADNRRRIWQKMFPAAAPLGALDFAALARLEVPGGNIRNIALNAAFLAAGARQSIDTTHVLQAARREYGKIDKLLTAAEFGAHYRQGAS